MKIRAAATAVLLLCSLAASAADTRFTEEIVRILSERQLDPPPPEEILALDPADLDPLLRVRDPYAHYLPPAEYAEFRRGDPSREGIGVRLSAAGGRYFLLPIPEGPAWQAGIRERVELLSVDGRSVRDQPLERVIAQLQGEAGSAPLLVTADPAGEMLSRRIERRAFTPPTVSVAEQDGLAVITIWDFRRRETLAQLRSGLLRSLGRDKRPLFDLRYAGGGDLYEALDCSGLFLPGGASVAAIEDPGGQLRELQAPGGLRLIDAPIFLLIGPGTASAAESFALALRRNGAAHLIGEPSYGKCLTQTLAPLSNGGAIRFSNGRLWGPNGTPCSPEGLQPDIPVAAVESLTAAEVLRRAKRSIDPPD